MIVAKRKLSDRHFSLRQIEPNPLVSLAGSRDARDLRQSSVPWPFLGLELPQPLSPCA
jgi:hypothetical protein